MQHGSVFHGTSRAEDRGHNILNYHIQFQISLAALGCLQVKTLVPPFYWGGRKNPCIHSAQGVLANYAQMSTDCGGKLGSICKLQAEESTAVIQTFHNKNKSLSCAEFRTVVVDSFNIQSYCSLVDGASALVMKNWESASSMESKAWAVEMWGEQAKILPICEHRLAIGDCLCRFHDIEPTCVE